MKKLRKSFLGVVAASSLGWSLTANAYTYADAVQAYNNIMANIVDYCSIYAPPAVEMCIAENRYLAALDAEYAYYQAIGYNDWPAAQFFAWVYELLWFGGSS